MRTTLEIRNLCAAVEQALDILEPLDKFGYPTAEERDEMEMIIDNLFEYQETDSCQDESVLSWLDGADEYNLCDYLKLIDD